MVASCGGENDAGGIDIPEGATFCSVFTGEWRDALTVSPVADPSAPERVVYWSEVLAALAPDEIAAEAQHLTRYARDIAEGATPSEATLSGSDAFFEWADDNCQE
jgi:hypothetical protein